jgi:Domain of unknown function (DUF6916)
MLEHLTYETFAGHEGETFQVSHEDGPPLALVLTEVATIHLEGWGLEGTRPARQPFTLLFVGTPDVVLPQRIYRFEHADIGAFEMLIVPVGRDAQGTSYEAVFT